MKQNFVPEMLHQAECYTTPPRPDYQSLKTPWLMEDDSKEWRETQKSHMNLLESAEDLLDQAEYSDDEHDNCEPMMYDYEQIYEGCKDYYEDFNCTEASVKLIASLARGEPLTFITEGGAEPEEDNNNERFTELLSDKDQVEEGEMHLHRAAQELLCIQ